MLLNITNERINTQKLKDSLKGNNIMMKIRLETANLENTRESHSCEIIDNSYGPDSTIYDYIELFMRALHGMSFLEHQIKLAVIDMAEDFKDEMNEEKKDLSKENLLDLFSEEPVLIKDESRYTEDDTQA